MKIFKNIFKEKDDQIKSYSDFWNWFLENETTFYSAVKENRNIQKSFFDKLSPKLNQLKDGFFYLTGMYNDSIAELVITPDGNIKNVVFAEELIKSAPKIDKWKFTALKPALEIKDFNILMDGYRFDSNNLSFYSIDNPKFPDEINIAVIHDDLNETNKEIITNGTFVFLDNFIGEYDFVTIIDGVNVIGKKDAIKEPISIDKLKDFLVWRQKEFIEKYEGVIQDTDNSNYSVFEAELQSGTKLLATINTDILKWDKKSSHPWILNISIKYKSQGNGMPDEKTYQDLNVIEDKIRFELKDYEGYLNIGRQTADGVREIYFACKDFRKPSKVVYELICAKPGYEISYDIYKDKYWRTFNRFIQDSITKPSH
jgi:hypothetical protein